MAILKRVCIFVSNSVFVDVLAVNFYWQVCWQVCVLITSVGSYEPKKQSANKKDALPNALVKIIANFLTCIILVFARRLVSFTRITGFGVNEYTFLY